MTGEKAALAELGRDQEWLVTKTQEITEKVRTITQDGSPSGTIGGTNHPPTPPKKRRSDLGKSRKLPAPTPVPAGSITTAQAQELCAAFDAEFRAKEEFAAAQERMDAAIQWRKDIVAALTAK